MEDQKENISNGKNRIFVNKKGLMQRFFKSRGNIDIKNSYQSPMQDLILPPPRITENGLPSRNGFVPAEVKMRHEVLEFQKREKELRTERRKSQPELMAMLESEDETVIDFDGSENSSKTSSGSLRTLDLFNSMESSLEVPGASNLIKHFENLSCNSEEENFDNNRMVNLIDQFENWSKTPSI